jgi:hypothetical protein
MHPISPFGRKSALMQTEPSEYRSLKPLSNQQKSPLTQTEPLFVLQKSCKRVIKRKSELDYLIGGNTDESSKKVLKRKSRTLILLNRYL